MDIKYPKVYLGKAKDGERIWLTPPSWDCGWYWGWGYIGNNNVHYHLSSLFQKTHLYDGIKEHFESFPLDKHELWTFCELVRTFYHLRETSDVITRGGSHYCTNPLKHLIQDADYAKHINTVLMPAIFVETYKLFEKKDNDKDI